MEEESREHKDDRPFRFEVRWVYHEGFDANIKNIWGASKDRNRGQWCKVVEECGLHLKKWNKEVYQGSQNRMGWLLRRLKKFRKMSPSPSVIEEYRKVEQELRDLRHQQETAAWQRCRPFVLRNGDKNTAYFHTKASIRKRRNRLKSLEDSNGVKQRSQKGMKSVVLHYFSSLFTMSRPEISLDQVDFIDHKITDAMETILSRPYSCEDIEAALAETL